jgi:Ca-activated chloride channel homolog
MPLKVNPLFDFAKVDFSKTSDVNLDIILQAPEKDNQKRIPLSISLAIDVSGSMDGIKLMTVKNTTEKLVQHLTENDFLSIVGFSDNAFEVLKSIPMTRENKDSAIKAIKNLRTLGSTNIGAGLNMATEMVLNADKNMIHRVIVLTDGLPNLGLCTLGDLVELIKKFNPKISVSCFGYGSDHDPELLLSMSNVGKGNFFYIDKDEDCNKAFAMELGSLLSIYGQNIKLTVTPSANMEFKEILSDYKCEQKNGYRLTTNKKIEIQIDDIFAGEKKHIVLKLSIPSVTKAVITRLTTVCNLTISYTNAETESFESSMENIRIQYVKPGEVPKEANEEVRKQLLILEAAKLQKEAQEKAEQGDLAGAQHLISMGLQNVHCNAGQLGVMAAPVAAMFENMSRGFSDSFTYRTSGSKMATAYSSAMFRGRSSSADTADIYKNVTQDNVLNSFSAPLSVAVDPTNLVFKNPPLSTFNMSSSTGDPKLKKDKEEEEEKV